MHEVRAAEPQGTSAEARAKKIALCAPISTPINLHNLIFSLASRCSEKKRTTASGLNFAC